MLCLRFGQPGFNWFNFFDSGLQLYVLLSLYLCFISVLYLNLYGQDDKSIFKG